MDLRWKSGQFQESHGDGTRRLLNMVTKGKDERSGFLQGIGVPPLRELRVGISEKA
jgi:hypothetical protein